MLMMVKLTLDDIRKQKNLTKSEFFCTNHENMENKLKPYNYLLDGENLELSRQIGAT